MNDDPVMKSALAKREEALAEVARWNTFIEMYRQVSGLGPDARPQKDGRSRGSSLVETEEAAIAAITRAERPMKTDELLTALESVGIEVGGQNPIATLSARLSRAQGLENVRTVGWRIKPKAIPDDLSDLIGVAPPPPQAPTPPRVPTPPPPWPGTTNITELAALPAAPAPPVPTTPVPTPPWRRP